MKKQRSKSIFLVLISLILLNAKGDKKNINAALIESSVAKISDNLYAGKYEVSNWLYHQFLNDLQVNKRSEDLKVAQIDPSEWVAKSNIKSLYDEYPVVNISYEAANLFCSWLTDKYNSLPGRKFKTIKFDLPNEQEWILAAKGKKENSIYATGNSLINEKGLPMANYTRTDIPVSKDIKASANQTLLAPVDSYWENDFGIYNMSGNVAEMISEKGVTKGGSYKDKTDGLKIDAKGNYQKSASNIGFRYFMHVVTD